MVIQDSIDDTEIRYRKSYPIFYKDRLRKLYSIGDIIDRLRKKYSIADEKVRLGGKVLESELKKSIRKIVFE